MSEREGDSLTGVWDGLLTYPRLLQPMTFTAVLFETGATIHGNTHETAVDGPHAGRQLTATVAGSREGSAVDFVKIYDPVEGRHTRQIIYQGTLNADATEIEGRWSIPGNWSGKFLMVRSGSATGAVEAQEREPAPAD